MISIATSAGIKPPKIFGDIIQKPNIVNYEWTGLGVLGPDRLNICPEVLPRWLLRSSFKFSG